MLGSLSQGPILRKPNYDNCSLDPGVRDLVSGRDHAEITTHPAEIPNFESEAVTGSGVGALLNRLPQAGAECFCLG